MKRMEIQDDSWCKQTQKDSIGGGNETKMMNNEIGGFIFEKIVFINEFSMKLWRIVIG